MPGIAAAGPTDEIQALVVRGQFKEAYERGRRAPDLLGEPAFDYWFGLAAIDAGHPGEGTLALERYVLLYPQDRTARLELGRGYFLMRDDRRARAEFEEILATRPPAGVRRNVQGFLDAIGVRERRYRPSASFFAEFGTGYDSNVNGGVANGTVRLPIGPVQVDPTGQKTDNGFFYGAAGAHVNVPLRPGWSAFAAGSADTRNHFTADRFDLRTFTVSGGAARSRERDLVRLTAAYGTLWLDNTRFRDLASLTGEWHQQVSATGSWSAFAQWAQLAYPGANEARDADLVVVGGGWRHVLGHKGRWVLTITGNAGEERNRRERHDLSRALYGGRAGFAHTPRDGLTLSLAASAQGSDYDQEDAFLQTRRRDWFYGLEAASEHAVAPHWTVRFELALTRNRSNVELFDFNRNIAAVKLRYDLR